MFIPFQDETGNELKHKTCQNGCIDRMFEWYSVKIFVFFSILASFSYTTPTCVHM
eukprot:m.313545 g.313545  ORF g.313545 m.313545 type:complete len:55 (+) comp16491_c2_seq1:495-659(+)